MIDHRGKMDVTLAKHSHARALKIRAGPLEFFDPPNFPGQTEASCSNKFHRLSLRISTYKKSAGAHALNRWRRSGNVVERSETVAQVAQAMISGQRDLRFFVLQKRIPRCICKSLRIRTYTKRGRGCLRPKADPSRSPPQRAQTRRALGTPVSALVMTALREILRLRVATENRNGAIFGRRHRDASLRMTGRRERRDGLAR